MIYGIGNDVIEVERIRNSIQKSSAFVTKIFSKNEIEYCESKGNSKYQSYSARFAAKEAFMKALGTGWRNGIKFSDIEILNDELGKPYVNLLGTTKQVTDEHNFIAVLVTLSHIKEYAIANILIEK